MLFEAERVPREAGRVPREAGPMPREAGRMPREADRMPREVLIQVISSESHLRQVRGRYVRGGSAQRGGELAHPLADLRGREGGVAEEKAGAGRVADGAARR